MRRRRGERTRVSPKQSVGGGGERDIYSEDLCVGAGEREFVCGTFVLSYRVSVGVKGDGKCLPFSIRD